MTPTLAFFQRKNTSNGLLPHPLYFRLVSRSYTCITRAESYGHDWNNPKGTAPHSLLQSYTRVTVTVITEDFWFCSR